jgi:hypothetical protein
MRGAMFGFFIGVYIVFWIAVFPVIKQIAADTAVIRSTCTQQPLPVKGEAPTLPKR